MTDTARLDPSGAVRPLRKIEDLERIVRARPGGGLLLEELEPIADEANFLVQNSRRVAVVWRRHSGPTFARALVNSGFDPELKIPAKIGDATLEELLLAMADVLQRHGSPALRRAIAANAYELLRCARNCTTLLGIIDALGAARLTRAAGERAWEGDDA